MNTPTLTALGAAWLIAALPGAAQPTATDLVFAGHGGFELKGTMVVPRASEGTRVPAVLLLPGSGPTDRNGNQPPMLMTDLLKQVAERLAADGVATLRFDKRAVRAYAERWPKAPEELNDLFAWECFVGDATAAYRFLREHPGVEPGRVAILGHSEGGLLALQIGHDLAGKDDAPAALVLAATAGRPIDVILREQIQSALARTNDDPEQTKAVMASLDGCIDAVKNNRPIPADTSPMLQPLFNPTVLKLIHSYFTIDPTTLAASYPGPVLILQGARDVQVSAERDTPRLEEAFKARPAGSLEVLVVPGASHNLKKPTGDADPGFTGPVAPEALDRLSSWLKETLR